MRGEANSFGRIVYVGDNAGVQPLTGKTTKVVDLKGRMLMPGLIEGHSVWGADLIGRIPGLESVARIVRHHHERLDGSGYHRGSEGRAIPVEARVLAAA